MTKHPHSKHGWRIATRYDGARRLLACGYKLCPATMIDDPSKRIADAARTVRMARKVFADELEGIERLPLWSDKP